MWGPVEVRDWQTGVSPAKATAMVGGGKRSERLREMGLCRFEKKELQGIELQSSLP